MDKKEQCYLCQEMETLNTYAKGTPAELICCQTCANTLYTDIGTLPQEVQDVIDAAKRWLGVDINDTTALDISYDDLRDAINSYEEATSD